MSRLLPTLLLAAVFGFWFSVKAAAAVTVTEIDIGIRPSAYKRLLSETEAEPNLSVQISVNGSALYRGKLKLRGSASKAIGLITPGKRFSLELKPDQTDLFPGSLDNSCVKLINSWTPMRLLGEYLALEMYEYMRIPTPAHTLTFLRFNGVDFGLYLAEEEVNAGFLRKIDPDGGGTLFKADALTSGSAYDASCWFGHLRIVEDRGLQRADALVDALNRGAGYEEYLDVDETLRYFACLAVWGADDTILTETKGSNFFLYDTGERFILIPWDSSEAFSAYEPWNGIDHFNSDPEKKENGSALFALLMENEACKKTYHDYIRQIIDGFLAPELLDARFNTLAAAAAPYLERDRTMLCNRPEEIPAVLEKLYEIHEAISAQLRGETDVYCADPGDLSQPDEDETDEADEKEKDAEEELNEGISFLIRYYSPNIDPNITEKICEAYPAWRRAQKQIPVDADDPAEIAVAAALFLTVFGLLILLKRGGRYGRKNKRTDPLTRRDGSREDL